MPRKPPSTRAYEHAYLSFGMVNIPCSIYTAVDSSHGISRKMFTTVPVMDGDKQKTVEVEREDGTKEEVAVTEDHEIGYGTVNKVTGELIDRSQTIKKVETEYGYVFVEDHEVEQLFEITPRTLEVQAFQPLHLLHQGHYVPKKPYYVEVSKAAGKGGKKVADPKMQQNLALIFAAMKTKNAMALVEFTTRGVPKPALLLPDGTLWEVYYADELREQRPLPDFEISVDVAKAAFDQYLKPFWSDQPVNLEDRRTALIQEFANEKAKAGDFGRSEEPEQVAAPTSGGMDLMAALSASVESAKAERETAV